MNTNTLILIRQAIQKWQNILEHGAADHGRHDCPLCQVYFNFVNNNDCTSCPIHEYTGQRYCDGTPYEDWLQHHDDIFTGKKLSTSKEVKLHRRSMAASSSGHTLVPGCPGCQKHAQAEVEFLKELLVWTTKEVEVPDDK